MVIMGIDPGIATVGFGIVETSGSTNKPVRYGVVTTPAGTRLAMRLSQIYSDITQLIETFKPEAIAIEELFFNNNPKTAISVAQGRGVIILAGENCHIPMYEYTPLQVKQAITGYGRADKKQMMKMVQHLLALPSIAKPDDASDALSLAICHARNATSLLTIQGGNTICSTI